MNQKLLLSSLLGAVLLLGAVAQARWVNVLPPVTKEDVEMMKAAARDRMDDQPEGTVNAWQNPASGNSGEVRLIRRLEENGRECRIVHHIVNVVQYSPWERRSKICRNDAGSWEIHAYQPSAATDGE